MSCAGKRDRIAKMTTQNANLLAGMPAKARTEKAVEAAQTMTEKDFQKKVVAPVMKKYGLLHKMPKGKGDLQAVGPNETRELGKIGPYVVQQSVKDNWDYAFAIMLSKVPDSDRGSSLIEKIIDMIAAEIRATYGAEYEQTKKAREEQEAAAEAAGQPPEQDQAAAF